MFEHIQNPHVRELAEKLYNEAQFSNCNSDEIQVALAEVIKATEKFPMYEAG